MRLLLFEPNQFKSNDQGAVLYSTIHNYYSLLEQELWRTSYCFLLILNDPERRPTTVHMSEIEITHDDHANRLQSWGDSSSYTSGTLEGKPERAKTEKPVNTPSKKAVSGANVAVAFMEQQFSDTDCCCWDYTNYSVEKRRYWQIDYCSTYTFGSYHDFPTW